MAIPVICRAQDPQMTGARQQAIIDKTLEHISANYVYADRVKAVEDAVRENVRAGKYDAGLTDALRNGSSMSCSCGGDSIANPESLVDTCSGPTTSPRS
jgi:hypothetical protein